MRKEPPPKKARTVRKPARKVAARKVARRPPEQMWLYRHFSPRHVLLYCGITDNPERRQNQHRRKPWYDNKGYRKVEKLPKGCNPRDHETIVIRYERPKHDTSRTSKALSLRWTSERKAAFVRWKRRIKAELRKRGDERSPCAERLRAALIRAAEDLRRVEIGLRT